MIKFHGSKLINETDKIITVTTLRPKKSWTFQRGEKRSFDLDQISQADHNESVGAYRIDFTIQGESDYGVFSIWTGNRQIYYSIEPGHYVSSTDRRVRGVYGGSTPALTSEVLEDWVANFRVTILNKTQIMVEADMEVFIPPAA